MNLIWPCRGRLRCASGPLALLALLCGLQVAPAASAQEAATRLGGILDLARASDAQYAAARAAAAAGREKLPQARAALQPNVNFTWVVKRNADGSSAYSDTQRYDAGGASLNVTQPLFRLVNQAGVEQAESQLQQTEQQLALAGQELLLRVAKGYFDVLQAQDELAAAGAQKDALVQQLAQARRSFEVGTVPVTDLNEVQARHDLAVAQEIAARNDLEIRKRVLERSIARPLPLLARLGASAQTELMRDDALDALVEAAARDAWPVRIARSAVDIAAAELRRRDAAHQPTLDLVATLRRDNNVNYGQFGGSETRQRSIGVELNVPLYQGGAVSSRSREAAAELLRTQEELSNAQRAAQLDAGQARLGVQSGRALTQALRQALLSSETQLRSTQRGQQVGVRTRVDVLNAEQQLFLTRKDLAAARYRALLALLQLKAAAGALADADLRGLDAFLTE